MDVLERQEKVFHEWWERFNLPDEYKRPMYQAFLIGWHDGLKLGIERYARPAPIILHGVKLNQP